jgi:ATP-dependent RNA helicase RhlE
MDETPTPVLSFAQTGLSPEVLTILEKEGLTIPTPIQAEAIPVGLQGGDLIGIAQTGTGKTLAFTLPLIERLRSSDGIGIILVPTRELALQVEESIRRVTQYLPSLRTISLIGGMPMYKQIQSLKNRPRLIIATPGRLNDHIERRTVRLDGVVAIVLDEADRMLDMGFAPQIEQIMRGMPTDRQTMMFSATMAPAVSRLVAGYTRNPTRIEVSKPGSNNILIRQELAYVAPARKTQLLITLLNQYSGPVLVFTRTKIGAGDLMREMRNSGHTSAEIHGDRSLRERRQALDGFKSGQYRLLIATDVAARGIDVPNIALVVNYDLPDASEDYTHRVGRTGRAGSEGLAITFASHNQIRSVKLIEGIINKSLIISEHSDPVQEYRPMNRAGAGGRSGRSGYSYNKSYSQGSRSRGW